MSKTKTFELSWQARKVGNRYCAPACGRGCTWDEYQLATKNAAALCQRLGKGWEPYVWENLGWHWRVHYIGGLVSVDWNKATGYHCMFSFDRTGAGDSRFYDTKHFKTPQEAIRHVLSKVYTAHNRESKIIEELRKMKLL